MKIYKARAGIYFSEVKQIALAIKMIKITFFRIGAPLLIAWSKSNSENV